MGRGSRRGQLPANIQAILAQPAQRKPRQQAELTNYFQSTLESRLHPRIVTAKAARQHPVDTTPIMRELPEGKKR